MKIALKHYVLTLLILLSIGSCKKTDSEDNSTVTHYVIITLKGKKIEVFKKGTPFAEPGYTAMEGSTDVTQQVKKDYDPEMPGNTPGFFTITYSATNRDGYSNATSRDVFIYDANDEVSGIYKGGRIGGSEKEQTVYIWKGAGGEYHIDDFFGGAYNLTRGYGVKYKGTSSFTRDGSSLTGGPISSGFGKTAFVFKNGSFKNGVIEYDAVHTTGFQFHVKITKQ